ncbi:MAG: DUF1634 domain-containing protein [Thaumarchaeota archaeon]|nr:DUF1634 domain-containing protein [Candidatus Calditenuaceae archaeon]MDW8041549.1 DUF1634 domain-containing protein [Nitrososphaerota archaeon]
MEVVRLLGKILRSGAVLSFAIMAVGLVMNIAGYSYVTPSEVFWNWTKGKTADEFWTHVGKEGTGYWFLTRLASGDAIGMIGISVFTVTMLAALLALFGAFISSKHRDYMYALFTFLTIVVILIAILGLNR